MELVRHIHLNPVRTGVVPGIKELNEYDYCGHSALMGNKQRKRKDVVTISGPEELRRIKGFHDEALKGEWKGHRSSRLGKQYRVFYHIRPCA